MLSSQICTTSRDCACILSKVNSVIYTEIVPLPWYFCWLFFTFIHFMACIFLRSNGRMFWRSIHFIITGYLTFILLSPWEDSDAMTASFANFSINKFISMKSRSTCNILTCVFAQSAFCQQNGQIPQKGVQKWHWSNFLILYQTKKKKNELWYQSPAWSQRNLWIMQGNGLLAGCRVLQERASGGAGEQDQLRAVIWSTALFWRSAEFILPLSEGEMAKVGLQVYYGKGIK